MGYRVIWFIRVIGIIGLLVLVVLLVYYNDWIIRFIRLIGQRLVSRSSTREV